MPNNYCHECGVKLEANVKICHSCGREIITLPNWDKNPYRHDNIGYIVIIGFFLALIVYGFIIQ